MLMAQGQAQQRQKRLLPDKDGKARNRSIE
jgi:hypothetical protein